jgi:riboflavin kinase/FMN adenylyltransferase
MLRGLVVHGDGLGKTFGYPTANLDMPIDKVKLSEGVYVARALLKDLWYDSALIINKKRKKIEVYLFDYNFDDCYGEMLQVDAVQKISEIESYDNEEELKKKIDQDIESIKNFLKGNR